MIEFIQNNPNWIFAGLMFVAFSVPLHEAWKWWKDNQKEE
jgi:hypothetical protein